MLQDSTRYEKTAKLLESYDPDYVPPTPRKQQQQQALRTAYIPGTPKAPANQAAVRCPTQNHSAPNMHQPLHHRRKPWIEPISPVQHKRNGSHAIAGRLHLRTHPLNGLLLHQGRGDRRLSLGPLQHMTGAGISLMPAFDKLATSLIGDNPALTEALRLVLPWIEDMREQKASNHQFLKSNWDMRLQRPSLHL